MGSMFRVMEKLRGGAGDPASAEDLAPETPTEATATAVLPAPDAPVAATGETPETRGAPEAAPERVAWDPTRIDPAIVAFHERYSRICEQFRAVRARLLSTNAAGAHRVIAITSGTPREGKSVCVANLGLLMAEGGEYRTLVVDADFRHPSLGRMLGLGPRPGLAELIRGEAGLDDLVCATPFANLKVLLPGKRGPQTAAELFSAPAVREVLARFRALFDYTLLDLPPVNLVSDVSLLAPHCDGALLVVRMHRTPEPAALQAVRTLQANHVQILGCIPTHHRRRTHTYERYSSNERTR